MKTIHELYQESRQGWGKTDETITITRETLAALCAHAQSLAIIDAHDAHSKQMREARAKARALRYHRMAEAILPSGDCLYDPRYSDAGDVGSWEVQSV